MVKFSSPPTPLKEVRIAQAILLHRANLAKMKTPEWAPHPYSTAPAITGWWTMDVDSGADLLGKFLFAPNGIKAYLVKLFEKFPEPHHIALQYNTELQVGYVMLRPPGHFNHYIMAGWSEGSTPPLFTEKEVLTWIQDGSTVNAPE